MTNNDMNAARNSALEIFESLTVAQSAFVRFNERALAIHENAARDELVRLAHYLGFSVERIVSEPAVAEQAEVA